MKLIHKDSKEGLKVGFIAFGGVGSKLLNYMLKNSYGIASSMLIDTDASTVTDSLASENIHLSILSDETKRTLNMENKSKITCFIKSNDFIIIIAAMGTKTGLLFSSIILPIAGRLSVPVFFMSTDPYNEKEFIRCLTAWHEGKVSESYSRNILTFYSKVGSDDQGHYFDKYGNQVSLAELFESIGRSVLAEIRLSLQFHYDGLIDDHEFQMNLDTNRQLDLILEWGGDNGVNAQQLVQEATDYGIRLCVANNNLIIENGANMPLHLIEALRVHKKEVLDILVLSNRKTTL